VLAAIRAAACFGVSLKAPSQVSDSINEFLAGYQAMQCHNIAARCAARKAPEMPVN